ncbi:MAG TPA: pyridoxamine 5'-phosphate oxidase family protein [Kiloniellales bacterium]|nr:pyridoxamine 5'-phosphate oxidase family protein [Kiloniellales bacterium]
MAKHASGSTPRTRLRRRPDRGAYDFAALAAVLDAQPLAHVGYLIEGRPFVTPTLQWREGERVYWHGSAASRMLKSAAGAEVCLTVSLFDGFVLARSAFNHSVNYRSAMLFGRAELVTDAAAKARHLETFVNRLFPGRWDELRPMTAKEAKATTVLTLPIVEGAAKVRSAPPKDDAEDYAQQVWAGVLPLSVTVGMPQDDGRLLPGVAVPEYLKTFKLG